MDPALLGHLDDRTGYLKPPEGDSRIAEIEGMLEDDVARRATTG